MRTLARVTLAACALAAICSSLRADFQQILQATGRIHLSVDGVGTAGPSAPVSVEKPSDSATVVAALLLAASYNSSPIVDGDVSLEGVNLTWIPGLTRSQGQFYNVVADVTDIVASAVDPRAAGTHDLTVRELNTDTVNGTVVAVLFSDPEAEDPESVILYYGPLSPSGDSFRLDFAAPFDVTDPGAYFDLGLGISHGCQVEGCTPALQTNVVTIDGTALTAIAGGSDDAVAGAGDGALITVGGSGDANDNPPPVVLPPTPTTDDELYSLLPFLDPDTQQVLVATGNASGDDNIFLAYVRSSVAVTSDDYAFFLTPQQSSVAAGAMHSVTAELSRSASQAPVPGQLVSFEVVDGPNANLLGSGMTDSNGVATFNYQGVGGLGEDRVIARVQVPEGERTSNEALVDWQETPIAVFCADAPCPCGNDVQDAGCKNSTGQGGLLTGLNSPSIDGDPLVLQLSQLPRFTFGIVFMGGGQTSVPFGDGRLCVVPGPPGNPPGLGFLRFPIRLSNGQGEIQEGPGIVTYADNNFGGSGLVQSGSTWNFQGYYRNPAGPCGNLFNLTNAVSVTFY